MSHRSAQIPFGQGVFGFGGGGYLRRSRLSSAVRADTWVRPYSIGVGDDPCVVPYSSAFLKIHPDFRLHHVR